MKNILSILTIIFSFQGYAQSYNFEPNWKVGDQFIVNSSTEEKNWETDSLVYEETTEMDSKIKVLNSSNENYKIQLVYKNFILNSYEKIYDQVDENQKTTKVLKLIYEVSKDGQSYNLINWEKARDVVFGINDDMIDKVSDQADQKNDKENLKEIMNPLLEMMNTKEAMESYFKTEIEGFISPYKCNFQVNDTLKIIEKEANPMGRKGDSLKVEFESWVNGLNKKSNQINLEINEGWDMEDFIKGMKVIMSKMMSSKYRIKDDMTAEEKAKIEKKNADDLIEIESILFDIKINHKINYNYKSTYVNTYSAESSILSEGRGKKEKRWKKLTVTFNKVK